MAWRWLLLMLLLGPAAAFPAATAQGQTALVVAQTLRGEVVSIGDGDTIGLLQGGRTITVRLACIDAPEAAQSPYGQQARHHLQQRLPLGREVTLAAKTTDRYGRTVAEVISDINVGLAMVAGGGGHHPPLGFPAGPRYGNRHSCRPPPPEKRRNL